MSKQPSQPSYFEDMMTCVKGLVLAGVTLVANFNQQDAAIFSNKGKYAATSPNVTPGMDTSKGSQQVG